jgi:hypothetical protein
VSRKFAGLLVGLLVLAAAVSPTDVGASDALQGLAEQPVADQAWNQTSSYSFIWHCLCNGEFFNQSTPLNDSEEYGAPLSVRIDSISVSGDLASSSEYVQFRLSGEQSYFTYQGEGDNSTYTTYDYTGPQPALSRVGGEASFFDIDVSIPSTVNFAPSGMDPDAYYHLKINMTVTYESPSTNVALTPIFGGSVAYSDGVDVSITNYDPAYTWSVSTTAGSATISASGLVMVRGLNRQQSTQIQVTTSRPGYANGYAFVTLAASAGPALVPIFSSSTSLAGGFTVQVLNYDSAYNWSATSDAGLAAINNRGLVSVAELEPAQKGFVTVRTSRSGYAEGSAATTGTALALPGLTPAWGGYYIPTSNGFQIQVSNYDSAYSWTVVSSEGSAVIDSSGLITVFGLGAFTTATVTVRTLREGYTDGESQFVGTSKARDGLKPILGTPQPTSDGFLVQVTNHDAAYNWSVSSDLGYSTITSSGLIELAGVTPGRVATVTVTTSRYSYTSESTAVSAPSAGVIPLEIGSQAQVQNLAQGESAKFLVDVDEDAAGQYSALLIGSRYGSGDVDLFVGEGFQPEPYQNYTCGSEGEDGSESCTMVNLRGSYYVNVYAYRAASSIVVFAEGLGPPDPPTLTQASPANLAAKVSFNAPADNGSAIVGYSASCEMVDQLSDRPVTKVVTGSDAEVREWRVDALLEAERPSRLAAPDDGILLKGPSINVYDSAPDHLVMNLIDRRIVLEVTSARKTPSDNMFLTGQAEDGGAFSLLVTPDSAMVGRIHWEGDLLLISPSTARGISVLRSVLDAELQPMPLHNDFRVMPGDSGEPVIAQGIPDSGQSIIDLLVLYDPELGKGAADYALQYTNDIHARSGTGVTFVASAFRAYRPGSSDPLGEIASSSQVQAWRDADRADLVAWLGPLSTSSRYCGVAYVPGVNGQSFNNNIKRLGFSVTLVGSAGGYYCTDEVLAHELGHNLGNLHDRANSGNNSAYKRYGYGDGINGVFGTVQSYLSPEQGKYSSPNLTCAGRPCGQANYTDVVRAIRDVKAVVAEVYPGTGAGGGEGRITVTPGAGFGGTVSPSGRQILFEGSTASFTFYPDTNYRLAGVNGNCQGNLDGDTYTVAVSGADCSFEGAFEPSGKYYTVSVIHSAGGTVTPSGAVKVTPGEEMPIAIEPASGFSLSEVWGSCGGVLSGGIFKTAEIVDDCSVYIRFARTGGVATGPSSPLLVTGLSEFAEYRCSVTATNEYGASAPSNSALVTPAVASPPGPPQITTVDSEDGSLIVYFTPGYTGLSDVTYTATCGGISVSAPASPIRVNGLRNEVPVSCQVKASNEKGSANSALVVATPGEQQPQGLPIWLLYSISSQSGGNDDGGNSYAVTASAGNGGSITPSGAQTVAEGGTVSFTLAAASGFSFNRISGSCPSGITSGPTYVTGAISADCTVVAEFTANNTSGYCAGTPAGVICDPNWNMDSWSKETWGFYNMPIPNGKVVAYPFLANGGASGAAGVMAFSNNMPDLASSGYLWKGWFSVSPGGDVLNGNNNNCRKYSSNPDPINIQWSQAAEPGNYDCDLGQAERVLYFNMTVGCYADEFDVDCTLGAPFPGFDGYEAYYIYASPR